MKKMILSLSIIFLFGFYSAFQRLISSNQQTSISLSLSSNPLVDSSQRTPTTPANVSARNYKDGQYIGNTTDAFYGNVQVKATIQNGKISQVEFLQYPNDQSTSREINSQAMPLLQQEAIQTQNANVNIISGATDTSQAFIASLASALNKAH